MIGGKPFPWVCRCPGNRVDAGYSACLPRAHQVVQRRSSTRIVHVAADAVALGMDHQHSILVLAFLFPEQALGNRIRVLGSLRHDEQQWRFIRTCRRYL